MSGLSNAHLYYCAFKSIFFLISSFMFSLEKIRATGLKNLGFLANVDMMWPYMAKIQRVWSHPNFAVGRVSLCNFLKDLVKTWVLKLPTWREDPKNAPKPLKIRWIFVDLPKEKPWRFLFHKGFKGFGVRPGLSDQSAMFEHPQAAGVETRFFRGSFWTKIGMIGFAFFPTSMMFILLFVHVCCCCCRCCSNFVVFF